MEEKVKSQLIFIAGIHGVGKSTFCREIVKNNGGHHVSASSLIERGTRLNKNKEVENVKSNQTILIDELKKERSKQPLLFLDGHFCLFGKDFYINRIPLETFREIAPSRIIVLYEETNIIRERLHNRDNFYHNATRLEDLQDEELRWSEMVSKKLKIPILKTKPTLTKNTDEFIKG